MEQPISSRFTTPSHLSSYWIQTNKYFTEDVKGWALGRARPGGDVQGDPLHHHLLGHLDNNLILFLILILLTAFIPILIFGQVLLPIAKMNLKKEVAHFDCC